MKKLIILSTFLFSLSNTSFASHFFNCSYEAKILSIKNLNRLDGTTTNRDGSIIGQEDIKDFEQLATLEITSMTTSDNGFCREPGTIVDLIINVDKVETFNQGDILNISYRNVGDSLGSSITWNVLR